MIFEDRQIKIINAAKSFLEKVKNSGIDTSLSSFCYFNTWSQTPGYARLKLEANGLPFLISFLKILFKNVLSIAAHSNYIQIGNSDNINNYKMLVLSWSYKENFQPDGSFQDRYLNENSKKLENTYWILISMDDYVPLNLNNNIKIIKKKKGILKYNFYFLIKLIILTVIQCKFSLKKIYHYLFFPTYFANIINKIIIKDLKKNNIKALLLPFEAQPFQNKIFFEAKKISKEIKTIGYLHAISPLTSELIYRSGSPDLLLVHGESQTKILNTKLGWPQTSLMLIDYLRPQLKYESLSKTIFIPMIIDSASIFLKEFKKLLADSPKNNFPLLNIKNHPTALNSKKHIFFIKKLEKIMSTYADRFSENSPNQNISIFFGVTAAILESLEKKISVIHVCSDPLFQSYNPKIWSSFIVKKLSESVFSYKLSTFGKCINFVEKKTLRQALKSYI